MNTINIDKFFMSEFLTCGSTYDNFVFYNCPMELISEAKRLLSNPDYGVIPCNITLTREDEIKIEKTLKNCINDLQTTCLARDFITALVMREVLKNIPAKGAPYGVVKEQIKAFYNNEFWKVKQYHATSFFPSDVRDFHKNYKRLEVNFFLIDSQNKDLQKAINNFISAREPYSVKIFTTNERFSTYYDQGGNLIQSPHDFMTRDVSKSITTTDNCQVK